MLRFGTLERLGWRVERDKLLQLLTPVTSYGFPSAGPGVCFFSPLWTPFIFPAAVGWEGMQNSKESGRDRKGVSQGSSAFWNGKAKAS